MCVGGGGEGDCKRTSGGPCSSIVSLQPCAFVCFRSLDELANRISLLESRSGLSCSSANADAAVPEAPPTLGNGAAGDSHTDGRSKRKRPSAAAPGNKVLRS